MSESPPPTKEEEEEECSDSPHSSDYQKLIDYGLSEKVASNLEEIYKQGKLSHEDLDGRALDALKEFPVEGAVTVLKQFLDSNLEHVSNKSAFLCGVMKTYRQRKSFDYNNSPEYSLVNTGKGPNDDALNAILKRTGYTLDVTTGQRKYGGPPPNWEGTAPGSGCEVFCGKIPNDVYEDELIPLFEKCGEVWDLRLMMNPLTGQNRGYAFVTLTTRDAAVEAVRQLDGFEIQPRKKLGVTISFNNHRLFVGNIPKNREQHELFEEFTKHAPGLAEVIIYTRPDDRRKNRGFCFLEYESHKVASLAKRRLSAGHFKVWGSEIIVDWADPLEEPDTDTMSKVKVLYVSNLTQNCTEAMLKEKFEEFGKVERLKKLKSYAFIHFEQRDDAVKAMEDLNGSDLGGADMIVSLAKPPSDKKKKEELLRNREKRYVQMLTQRGGPLAASMLRSAAFRSMGRGYNDYDYDFYGYNDYQGGYSDPYFDDFYNCEDYYYDYSPPQAMGGRTPRNKPVPPMGGRLFGMPSRGRSTAGPYPRGGGRGGGLIMPTQGPPRGGPTGIRMGRPMRGGAAPPPPRGNGNQGLNLAA